MSQPTLTFACGLYDRMQPLYTGEVQARRHRSQFHRDRQPRADLRPHVAAARNSTRRNFRAPNSSSASPPATCPFVAHAGVPVARLPPRLHRHQQASPASSRRRISRASASACRSTRMTAAIFIRGMLQHEYGVDLSKIHWVQGAMNHAGAHGNPTVLPLLKKMSIENNTIRTRSLSELLDEGEIDATLGTSLPDCDPHQSRYRAAVSELRRGRERLLQAHQDLSDHASRRDQAATSTRHIRSSRRASTTLRQIARRSRWRRCSTCARCAT